MKPGGARGFGKEKVSGPVMECIFLRWGSPENLMKSAYLVAQGYANFCKMVSMVIIIAILTNFWKFAYPSATTLSD